MDEQADLRLQRAHMPNSYLFTGHRFIVKHVYISQCSEIEKKNVYVLLSPNELCNLVRIPMVLIVF